MEKTSTLEKIQASAKREFLEKGFQAASLRNIVKNAGVTTGAFYGYYKSKEDLFDALVEEAYTNMMNMYVETQNYFKTLDANTQQNSMGEYSGQGMQEMLTYMYAHEDEFRLILTCSKGTRYENMVHEMSQIEVQATHDFVKVMRDNGREVREIDSMLEHVLISGMFSAFFELLLHRESISDAEDYLRQLRAFYTAGWRQLFGMEVLE